jgi:hypothetical protein
MSKIDSAANRWADAQHHIGQLLPDNVRRDALHFAVAPAVAGPQSLKPAAHIGINDQGVAVMMQPERGAVGIVDPFLRVAVKPGERFWLVLYPNTITSLRHVWDHPAFAAEPGAMELPADKVASEAWLRDWIAHADCPDYDTVMAAITGGKISVVDESYGDEPYRVGDDYIIFHGRDAHSSIPPEFWDHAEVVTGQSMEHMRKVEGFSCSC